MSGRRTAVAAAFWTMKASLIIPYRHDDENLLRMRGMVAAQTFRDFEALFCHDPDGLGPSWARNQGLEKCRGEIVLFADVDDEIKPDYVERLVEACEGVDLVWGRYKTVTSSGSSVSPSVKESEREISGSAVRKFVWKRAFGYRLRDLPKAFLPGGLWRRCGREFGSVCARAFRRSAIGDLRFEESLRLYEDAMFLSEFALRAQRMRAVDYVGYRYVIRPSGGMTRESEPARKLAAKFVLRDVRRRIDPAMSHWRGTWLLSALETLRLGGVAPCIRYMAGLPQA